jgi:uncharacterized protein (TIGR02466 family)
MSFQFLELYPTPVYVTEFTDQETDLVQTEMLAIFEDLKNKNHFDYKHKWNTHKLSDTTFTGNVLEHYDCSNFLNLLDSHVSAYLMYSCKVPQVQYEITQSWLTLSTNRDYAHIHNHGASHVSGCYYIKTNGLDGEFMIPCTQTPLETNRVFANASRTTAIQPKVGKMLLFPGWMNHGVGTNCTDNERVSLSFNIQLKDAEKPDYKIY